MQPIRVELTASNLKNYFFDIPCLLTVILKVKNKNRCNILVRDRAQTLFIILVPFPISTRKSGSSLGQHLAHLERGSEAFFSPLLLSSTCIQWVLNSQYFGGSAIWTRVHWHWKLQNLITLYIRWKLMRITTNFSWSW